MTISEFISKFRTHPVLFIGAGISLRYYEKAYSWESLLKTIATELNKGNTQLYLDLRNKAMDALDTCDYPSLATALEEEIDVRLKESSSKADSIPEIWRVVNEVFYETAEGNRKTSRLKIWVKELLSALELNQLRKNEIPSFKKACEKVASIVTTNYDTFVEDHLGFSPLLGNDILLSNPYQSVYKIHGSITDPSNMVLTKEDYDLFNHRYELIQAQLISLFIHNPIVFLGYSINDANIQKLLSVIFSYVDRNSNLGRKVAENFLCVQYERDSENLDIQEETFHIRLGEREADIPINVLKTDNFIALYDALSNLQLPVEAVHLKRVERVFRRIKLGGEIAVKLVGDLENVDNRELVLAIGPIDRIDVSLDKIYRVTEAIQSYFEITEEFKSGMVILTDDVKRNMCFPAKGMAYVFPEMERKDELCKQQNELLNKEFDQITTIPGCCSDHTSVNDILRDERIALSYKVKAIFYQVYRGGIALDDVRSYLYNRLKNSAKSVPTDIRKLLCLYDARKYSEEESSRESL